MANVSKVKLNNGVEIPQLGLGVYKVKDGQLTFDTVSYALQHQYRLIDTAALYGNEKSVGRAIKESKLPRDQIFITTKLWNSEQGYKSTLAAFEKSIGNLGIDYLDLYLIHWPSHNLDLTVETWQAFEEI